ncbi:MAG: T9SS sorting signal type C domain-containing protein [Bacteroidota bacterium]
MKIKLPFLFLFFCATIVFAQPRLLGIDSSRALYQIDMATGVRTSLGTVGASAGTTGGLAYDRFNNILYLTSSGNDALYLLNRTTLAVTLVGSYGDTAIVMHGLEYHEPTGKLYGMSSHNGGLYDINKITGVATLVGVTGLTSFSNLGWDSTNNIMYLTNTTSDSFYSINVTTAAVTLIGALVGPTSPQGLAYDHNLDRLFLIDNTTDNLYTINRTTGVTTVIGSVGSGNYLGLVYINEVLGTDDFVASNVQMYQSNQQLVIDSQNDNMLSVELYDITGRSLYRNPTINEAQHIIELGQFGNQVLIVKVQTEGGIMSKKIIIK